MTRPSIWTSAILEVLLQHPEVTLTHVSQYQWGAPVTKPTGFLHYQMPGFRKHLYRHADSTALKPKDIAIGRDSSGQFRTSRHKEYPARFCKGLASTIVQALASARRQHEVCDRDAFHPSLLKWIQGAAIASSKVHRNTWLPDFQG